MLRDFETFSPQVDAQAWVDPSALVIGDVQIGANTSIWPMTVIRGDIHQIRIGENTNIQDGSVLHVTHDSEFAPGGNDLRVGDGVTIGHKVILHACHIGNRCLVGMGAVVMDGAVLQDGAMVGAGSLVSPGKIVEGGYLWLGSPARRIRELTDKEKAFLDYSAEHYVALMRRHRS